MYFVYILHSKRGDRYYVGYTSDVVGRIRAHNAGKNTSTKPHRPWQLVHQESYLTKKEAWLREKQIKSYKGGEAFRKLLEL